jgi:Mrp family chromosome partitioning ATPase
VVHCNSHLNVLAEGRVRVPGMLQSERFSAALSQLRLDYDVIIIDGPPIGNVTDARALDGVTDGIVFVAASTAHAAGTHNAASKWFGAKRMSTLVLADPA